MTTPNLPKIEHIDVRASTPVKQLLQEAVRACHKNVSEFLLDAGVTAATQTYVCCRGRRIGWPSVYGQPRWQSSTRTPRCDRGHNGTPTSSALAGCFL
ncbi:hypothetical protein C0Z18_13845 [Trinickia dabaoshanensis]|uniref:DUF1778 domain-containing protein n=1 Tax=Trinickia dabaoshanensis TaxID=564714 RepID=A0A2N7VQH9_9BURK|nr:DUF1778 domain-containing protein [Trinickia dabaoshanensis]PMS19401.1 hypothetical protein C0Z18_13845 [Trinickia dabaoshanensis]